MCERVRCWRAAPCGCSGCALHWRVGICRHISWLIRSCLNWLCVAASRVSTCQLQHSLLKIALLVGVRVHFNVELNDLSDLSQTLADLEESAATATQEATAAPMMMTAALHPHPLMRCYGLPGHHCDIGRSNCGEGCVPRVPTAYRCAECDFDVCEACYDAAVSVAQEGASTSQPASPAEAKAKRSPSSMQSLLRWKSPAPSAPASQATHAASGASSAALPDVLVDATGARCELFSSVGLTHAVALRTARALCIVLHLVNGRTAEEMHLHESTWSSQYVCRARIRGSCCCCSAAKAWSAVDAGRARTAGTTSTSSASCTMTASTCRTSCTTARLAPSLPRPSITL
jgi:hypothetical protein